MIQLNYNNPQQTSITHLTAVQQAITNQPSFRRQVEEANRRWHNKTGSQAATEAFADVKLVLSERCSGKQICVYCEHNEATDIEHIFPKRLYPEKAFTWTNYVLACCNCNTHYKREHFKIFNPVGSLTVEDITPQRDVFTQPVNDDALFINQRNEDPMRLLELDLLYGSYLFIECQPHGTRAFEKAKYTKDLLGLNERADLVRQRKAAHKFYFSELRKYVDVKNATNFTQLIDAFDSDVIVIDLTALFATEKQRALDVIKNDILSHSHPTVWNELKRQRSKLPKTNILFSQAPELL
jgi:hypothetical protein